MRYLITGATGFIGPYLVRSLKKAGHSSRCLVRASSNTAALADQEVELVPGDVTDRNSLAGVADGMDVLVHMATLGHMSNFAAGESDFEQINVRGTVNMMKTALAAGVEKIVHCSTVAAMGICSDVPATEESRCSPHHPYGRSKLQAEKEVLRLVAAEKLPAVIIRFSMVYGPGDPRDVLKLTRLAKRGLLPKVGRRPKLTPLVHVEDAVDGILCAAARGKPGAIYLITNRRSEPFDKIAAIIKHALGVRRIPLYIPEWTALAAAFIVERGCTLLRKPPPVTVKNIESTLADRVFSIEKAQRELGFDPKIDPATGLRETVAWYQDHGWV